LNEAKPSAICLPEYITSVIYSKIALQTMVSHINHIDSSLPTVSVLPTMSAI